MTTNSISTTPSTANTKIPYTDHSGDYIPKISPWNRKLTCSYLDAGNTAAKKTCCSDVKMIDRAIDKAYQNGVQSHLGITAIQDYPCVTQAEMSRLSNDLGRVIEHHGIKMEIPEEIDLAGQPGGARRSTMQYCKGVVFERLSRELGKVVDSKPIAFSRDVLNYCKNILTFPMRKNDPSYYTILQ
ncbi:hypothetical protein [Armatimonas sp.]|uniref:hypothetical protein n=1 Tax=Armatimonas sp. TaxID=1872638 RepID=UPI0037519DCC